MTNVIPQSVLIRENTAVIAPDLEPTINQTEYLSFIRIYPTGETYT